MRFKGHIKSVVIHFPEDGADDSLEAGDEWAWELPPEEERGKARGKKGKGKK